jgi:hypothetical protein
MPKKQKTKPSPIMRPKNTLKVLFTPFTEGDLQTFVSTKWAPYKVAETFTYSMSTNAMVAYIKGGLN